MHKPRIFISAVTRDMGAARQHVANTLLELGFEPEWQDVFETEHGDLREILRRRIQKCSGVVHIVGHCYGMEPPTPDPDFGRVSYTQYEALYAEKIGKPVWRILATSELTASDAKNTVCRESEELQNLQISYRDKLEQNSSNLYHVAASTDSLKLAVMKLRSDLAILRRRAQIWSALIVLIGVCTIGMTLWLTLGQASISSDVQDAKNAGDDAAVAAEEAKEEAAAGQRASQAAHEAADSAQSEAAGARNAAVNAQTEANAARRAAEDSGKHIDGLASQAEIEHARRTVEDAIVAGDRSLRGQVQAMERLLVSGFAYTGADLDGLSLKDGFIPGGDFSDASLRDSDFTRTNLTGGSLAHADMAFAELSESCLRAIQGNNAHFEYILAHNVNFSNGQLQRSTFFCSNLNGADFSGADLTAACFAYCDLSGANFDGANLSHATFYGAILDGVSFEGAVIVNVDVTGAVASEPLTFTHEQITGLRRTQGIHRLDIKIWGDIDDSGSKIHSIDLTAFNSYYTDFDDVRVSSSGTIAFRSNQEFLDETEACVGSFRDYAQGHGDIRCLETFRQTYWDKPGRERRITGRLRQHATLLVNRLNNGRVVEGSNEQWEAWMAHIEAAGNQVELINPELPLLATNDSILVLLLSADVINHENVDWVEATSHRLDIDSDLYKRPESYAPFFHPTAHNIHLPQYNEAYQEWTIRRAEFIEFPIEVTFRYSVSKFDFLQLRPVNGESSDAVLLFEPKQRHESDAPLANLYRQSNSDMIWADRWVVRDCGLRLPQPRAAWCTIPGNIPSNAEEYIDLRITFRVASISVDENRQTVLNATPLTLSYHNVEGEVQWSSPIELHEASSPDSENSSE